MIAGDGSLAGVLTRSDLHALRDGRAMEHPDKTLRDIARRHPTVAFCDEPLRTVVYRMAETGLTRFPVVEREGPGKLAGMITLKDLLRARVRDLEEESRRERVLHTRFLPFAKAESERDGHQR